jgi:hypothetical protein
MARVRVCRDFVTAALVKKRRLLEGHADHVRRTRP